MPHPLVNQLYFARKEFQRCLTGISEEDAIQRIMPMNCLSWIIGHLAHQENSYWNFLGSGEILFPDLRSLVGYGKPASTPPLTEMQKIWKEVTHKANIFLETLSTPRLEEYFTYQGKSLDENIGSLLQRNIYHYWFHTGEAHAIRQQLGHADLPDFVGEMQGFYYKHD